MIGAIAPGMRHALRALRRREFRLFWIGQWVSVTGTWMQTMALSWLVYRLTGSPLTLGLLSAARFGPSLLCSPLAGVITDRFPRRTLVLLTQSLSLLQATALAALTLAGLIEVWHALILAALQGVIDTVDMPARQTLQVDLVGLEDLQSAVSLNSSAFNVGRMVGPALAGVLVARFGEGACFAFNAASYSAVLVALLTLPPAAHEVRLPSSWRRDLAEGILYSARDRRVRWLLVAVTVTSVFGLSYGTLLPALARDVLGEGPRGYGALLAAAGLGAVFGALLVASRRGDRGTGRFVGLAQAAIGVGLAIVAGVHALWQAVPVMVMIGLAVSVQLSITNGSLQTMAPSHLRGRVMALYAWLFVGLSPIGGLASGWLAERFGVPLTLTSLGVGCMVSGLLVARGSPGRALAAPTT